MAKASGLSRSDGPPHLARPSRCSRIARRPSSCRPIRCSSKRCATSWASTCARRTTRWCCAWTRRVRFRRSIVRSHCLPMRPGQVERRTHDYKRHGTTSLFAALEMRRRARSSARCIAGIASSSSASSCDTIDAERAGRHWISISSWTTTARTRPPSFGAGSPSGPASTSISRPPYGSWLNLVERWFAELTHETDQARGAPERRQMKRAIHDFCDTHNEAPKTLRVDESTNEECLTKHWHLAQRHFHRPQRPD